MSKPEFPKSYGGTSVHISKVRRILTNVLYAGYLQFSDWSISLTEARHSPLISFATYQIIQHRLDEWSVSPARKDIRSDFPLRGFLICAACGHPLTACWTRSHTGQRYPYYLCQYRTCSEKEKSIPRDRLEAQFSEHLKAIVPTQTTFELAEEMFRDAWNARSRTSAAETKRLAANVRQIGQDIENLLRRIVQTDNENITSAYERHIIELQKEKAVIEEEASRLVDVDQSFDEMFELAMSFLSNPYSIWEKGDLSTKKTVLRLVYSKPLTVSRKTGVQTGIPSLPFKTLQFLEQTNLKVAHPRGHRQRLIIKSLHWKLAVVPAYMNQCVKLRFGNHIESLSCCAPSNSLQLHHRWSPPHQSAPDGTTRPRTIVMRLARSRASRRGQRPPPRG